MKLRYSVHRVSSHPFPTQATLPSGETVEATVHSIEVELVPVDHHGGTVLHRFIGQAAAEASKIFHQGDVVALEPQIERPEPTVAPAPAKA
jgi:hypothetical protein